MKRYFSKDFSFGDVLYMEFEGVYLCRIMNTWIFEGVYLTCIEFMRILIESTRILTYFVRCSSNMKLFI